MRCVARARGAQRSCHPLARTRTVLTPTQGFRQGHVRMTINTTAVRGDPDRAFPQADTCFFHLWLPPYSSRAVMERMLLYVITQDCGLDADE